MVYQPSTYIPSVPVVFVWQAKCSPFDNFPEMFPSLSVMTFKVEFVFLLMEDKQLSIDENFADITSLFWPQPDNNIVKKRTIHKFFIYILDLFNAQGLSNITSEFTGLRGSLRRSGGMMG
jgi:hypothetical protein